MDKLKPCPFCGGAVNLERAGVSGEWWGIVCRNTINIGGTCAVEIRRSATPEAAIKRWNLRAPALDAYHRGRAEGLREAAKVCGDKGRNLNGTVSRVTREANGASTYLAERCKIEGKIFQSAEESIEAMIGKPATKK